ncbi:hypothetical protein D3C76_1627360 [compost metagenome]
MSQRKAPGGYTSGELMAPAGQPAGSSPGQPVQHNDNRQFHIHGADTEQVKKLYNEQMSTLVDQTAQDFRSPER